MAKQTRGLVAYVDPLPLVGGPCSPTAPVVATSIALECVSGTACDEPLAHDGTADVALWCELLLSGVRDQVEQHQRRDYEPALQSNND